MDEIHVGSRSVFVNTMDGKMFGVCCIVSVEGLPVVVADAVVAADFVVVVAADIVADVDAPACVVAGVVVADIRLLGMASSCTALSDGSRSRVSGVGMIPGCQRKSNFGVGRDCNRLVRGWDTGRHLAVRTHC